MKNARSPVVAKFSSAAKEEGGGYDSECRVAAIDMIHGC